MVVAVLGEEDSKRPNQEESEKEAESLQRARSRSPALLKLLTSHKAMIMNYKRTVHACETFKKDTHMNKHNIRTHREDY